MRTYERLTPQKDGWAHRELASGFDSLRSQLSLVDLWLPPTHYHSSHSLLLFTSLVKQSG